VRTRAARLSLSSMAYLLNGGAETRRNLPSDRPLTVL
jgi:hypothetical protein